MLAENVKFPFSMILYYFSTYALSLKDLFGLVERLGVALCDAPARARVTFSFPSYLSKIIVLAYFRHGMHAMRRYKVQLSHGDGATFLHRRVSGAHDLDRCRWRRAALGYEYEALRDALEYLLEPLLNLFSSLDRLKVSEESKRRRWDLLVSLSAGAFVSSFLPCPCKFAFRGDCSGLCWDLSCPNLLENRFDFSMRLTHIVSTRQSTTWQ